MTLWIRVGYFGTQLGHSTRASTSTERESIRQSITLAAIALSHCVAAAQWQVAALLVGKTKSSPDGGMNRTRRSKQKHSSLRERELLAGPATN